MFVYSSETTSCTSEGLEFYGCGGEGEQDGKTGQENGEREKNKSGLSSFPEAQLVEIRWELIISRTGELQCLFKSWTSLYFTSKHVKSTFRKRISNLGLIKIKMVRAGVFSRMCAYVRVLICPPSESSSQTAIFSL